MERANLAVPFSPPEFDCNILKVVAFKFDPVLYVEQEGYVTRYTNKMIYYIIEVVNANPNITINQVCGLLRNTLQIPEDLTRSTITALIFYRGEDKIFKVYESAKDIKHLTLAPGYFAVQKQISESCSELLGYEAPIYTRKKREDNSGCVTEPEEVN